MRFFSPIRTTTAACALALALSSTVPGYSAQAEDFNTTTAVQVADPVREAMWNYRVNVYNSTENTVQPLKDIARGTTDAFLNLVAPGIIAQKEEEARLAAEEARRQAEEAARAEAERIAAEKAAAREAEIGARRATCPATARACVDLTRQEAWLQTDGRITYGPIPASGGAPGFETTTGNLTVLRKVKDEVSYEFNMAPMPYSVYFTTNGMAFHQGVVGELSHGCIHLNRADAQKFFNTLNIGDSVYIFK